MRRLKKSEVEHQIELEEIHGFRLKTVSYAITSMQCPIRSPGNTFRVQNGVANRKVADVLKLRKEFQRLKRRVSVDQECETLSHIQSSAVLLAMEKVHRKKTELDLLSTEIDN